MNEQKYDHISCHTKLHYPAGRLDQAVKTPGEDDIDDDSGNAGDDDDDDENY